MSNVISETSTRVKTALILFFSFVIVSFVDSFFLVWLFFGFFLLAGVSESKKLFGIESDYSIYQYVSITWIIAYFYPNAIELIFIVLIFIASRLAYKKDISPKLIFPILYPLTSFIFLLTLYSEYSMQVLWWILFIVASADTGAYFVGRAIGKTKFCETSPKKTLEGLAGGIVLAGLLAPFFAIEGLTYFQALSISIVVAFASVFGDLFESYLKREANVKDSGNILPGHGGVLDRTDGFLFGAVVMLVLLRIVM